MEAYTIKRLIKIVASAIGGGMFLLGLIALVYTLDSILTF